MNAVQNSALVIWVEVDQHIPKQDQVVHFRLQSMGSNRFMRLKSIMFLISAFTAQFRPSRWKY